MFSLIAVTDNLFCPPPVFARTVENVLMELLLIRLHLESQVFEAHKKQMGPVCLQPIPLLQRPRCSRPLSHRLPLIRGKPKLMGMHLRKPQRSNPPHYHQRLLHQLHRQLALHPRTQLLRALLAHVQPQRINYRNRTKSRKHLHTLFMEHGIEHSSSLAPQSIQAPMRRVHPLHQALVQTTIPLRAP